MIGTCAGYSVASQSPNTDTAGARGRTVLVRRRRSAYPLILQCLVQQTLRTDPSGVMECNEQTWAVAEPSGSTWNSLIHLMA